MSEEQPQQPPSIFAKIAQGEIPSTPVFKDTHVMAVMDINPPVDGHVVLFPVEQYSILPIVPPEVSKHLFAVARDLSRAIKTAKLTESTTLFIANGGAAGQQVPHMLMHIFPREKGDALQEIFFGSVNSQAKEQQEQLQEPLAHNLQIMLSRADLPIKEKPTPQEKKVEQTQQAEQPQPKEQSEEQPKQEEPKQTPVSQEQKKALGAYIEQHPEFEEALRTDLNKVQELVAQSEELQQLTTGINLAALHEKLKSLSQEQNEGDEHA